MHPPKTVDDLPNFLVSDISRGDPSESGYIEFRLDGVFNQTEGVRVGKGWLLLPERDCLYGHLRSLNSAKRTAIFETCEKEEPKVKGRAHPYLDGYWQAYHVWMVTEPEWKWKKVIFQSSDAGADRMPGNGSTLDAKGQPIKEWIRIRKVGDTKGKERMYPRNSLGASGLPEINADGIIPLGWDHEHCELCNAHIEQDDIGFVDLSGHWICERCYTNYVSTHDLSFMHVGG